MNALQSEEKKESEVESKSVAKEEEEEEENEEDEEVRLLSSELAALFGDQSFETDASLQEFMHEKGIGDFRIILRHGKPCQVIPTDQHNTFTTDYVSEFASLHGRRWGCATGTHNVHIGPTNSHREPDTGHGFFWVPSLQT